MLTDVTDYDAESLTNYVNYIESHGKEEMYAMEDDNDARFKAFKFQRA